MTITNFASGELSQNLKGRVDLQQYYTGAQKIENFEIIPTGGIQRRIGMERMGKLHGECRLIPFIIDKNTSFILEFIPGKIYFWKNGRCMKTVQNEDYYEETSYTSIAEIKELQYAQNYDVLIFTQKNYRPLIVKYDMADDTFNVNVMQIDYIIDVNIDDDYGIIKKIDKDGYLPLTAEKGDLATYHGHLYKCIKSSDEQYAAEWEMEGDDPEVNTGLWENLDAEDEEDNRGKYPSCCAFFQNRLYLASTANNPQRIWASAAPDTEGTRYNEFSTYQKYITVNKTVKDPDIHLFTADINVNDVDKSANQTILRNVSQDLTDKLKESPELYYCINSTLCPAGSNAKIVSITENTIIISRALDITDDQHAIVFTLSLWANSESASASDYEYVVVNNNTTTSDCSFYLEPASDQNDAIKFMAPASYLVIGTESNVWNIPSGINALNIACIMNGRYGSDDIQAHVVDTAVIFFAQGKRGIREYYYNAQTEAFQTNNIAILAEQMLSESPAEDFDFCTNPYNRLIVTRNDGTAVTLLYDKNNGVMAWNRIRHGKGLLKSCAVTRGSGYCDLVYFSVQDGTDFYLEKLDLDSKVYLDSYEVKAEDKEYPEDMSEVQDGEVVYIGYQYESIILSMPVVTQDISQKKRIVDLYVRFNNSFMPVMKTTGMPDEYFTGVEEPFSGVKKIEYPGKSEIDVTFELTINDPVPCNILSVDASLS